MPPSFGFFPCATSAGVLAFAVAQAVSTQTPDRTTLPIAPPPFRGNITRDYRTSSLEPTGPLTAPKGAPNILLILLDDAGYGQTATFGGMIQTPTLDSLAQKGLRYTRFHVTALCSPTRSALMTGGATITLWAWARSRTGRTDIRATPDRFRRAPRSSPRFCARTGMRPRLSASGI